MTKSTKKHKRILAGVLTLSMCFSVPNSDAFGASSATDSNALREPQTTVTIEQSVTTDPETGTTTTDTTTTTTTITTDNILISDNMKNEPFLKDESNPDYKTGDMTSDRDQKTDGDWTFGNAQNDGNGYQPNTDSEKNSDGNPTVDPNAPYYTHEDTKKSEELPLKDPLDDKDMILGLTPGGQTQKLESVTIQEVQDVALSADPQAKEIVALLNQSNVVNGIYTTTDTSDPDKTVTTVYQVHYAEDGKTIIGYTATTTTSTVTRDATEGETAESITETTTTQRKPEGYTTGIKDAIAVTDQNGNGSMIEEVNEILDREGNVIGYEIIKTTTYEPQSNTVSTPLSGGIVTDQAAPVTEIILPAKPTASETTDPTTGTTTTILVEDILENGTVIGYQTTTITKDKRGKELHRASESHWGTIKTTATTTVTTPERTDTTTATQTVIVEKTYVYGMTETRTTKLETERITTETTTVTTDERKWNLIGIGDSLYFEYKGWMSKVGAITSDPDYQHGELHFEYDKKLVADLAKHIPTNQNGNDLRSNPKDGGGYTGEVFAGMDQVIADYKKANGANFIYSGYGLYGDFLIKDSANDSHLTRQYALTDQDGNTHYVYCIEFGKALQEGSEYQMSDLHDATYYKKEDVAKIQSIAENGFWGTTSGMGSLENVRKLLRDNGYQALANDLTAGQALAATQAAFWTYGNNGSLTINRNNLFGGELIQVHNKADINRNLSETDKAHILALYDTLIRKANADAADQTTAAIDMIDLDSITESAIIIKDKAEVAANKDQNPDNDVYNTDISFTLAVSPASVKGDLMVYVFTEGKSEPIAAHRLSGSAQAGTLSPTKNQNGELVYTIRDLQLAEGVNITLNLEGIQQLNQGVYLYSSTIAGDKHSQTLIGLGKAEREVNLAVNLKFTVTEPSVKAETSNSTKTTVEEDVFVETKTDYRTDTLDYCKTNQAENVQIWETTDTRIYADKTVTEIIVEKDKQSHLERSHEEPSSDHPGEDPTITPHTVPSVSRRKVEFPIVKRSLSRVPLASVPKTGDSSYRWLLLSAGCGTLLAVWYLYEKIQKNDDSSFM